MFLYPFRNILTLNIIKMKKCLLLFSVLLVALTVNAQTDFKEEVVETTLTKDVMWNNLKKWVSSSFNSSKNVVDLEDKENGVLIIKSRFSIPSFTKILDLRAEPILQIDVRDNKYRIRLSDEYINIGPDLSSRDGLSTGELREMANDLELIVNVVKTERVLVASIPPMIEEQTEIFNGMQKFKNEKAEKKGKVSPEYARKERDIAILTEMVFKYASIKESIIASLKKQMVYVDDF